MREILFQGKSVADGRWVEGSLFIGFGKTYICPDAIAMYYFDGALCLGEFVEVDPGTVGQYTGLTDKNGKKIFEGDIIKADNGKQLSILVVKFGEYYPKMFYDMLDVFVPVKRHLLAHGFYAVSAAKGEEVILFQSPCAEVIGNIHDNPELLEVSDNG